MAHGIVNINVKNRNHTHMIDLKQGLSKEMHRFMLV